MFNISNFNRVARSLALLNDEVMDIILWIFRYIILLYFTIWSSISSMLAVFWCTNGYYLIVITVIKIISILCRMIQNICIMLSSYCNSIITLLYTTLSYYVFSCFFNFLIFYFLFIFLISSIVFLSSFMHFWCWLLISI